MGREKRERWRGNLQRALGLFTGGLDLIMADVRK
jgi:hypothetical protein